MLVFKKFQHRLRLTSLDHSRHVENCCVQNLSKKHLVYSNSVNSTIFSTREYNWIPSAGDAGSKTLSCEDRLNPSSTSTGRYCWLGSSFPYFLVCISKGSDFKNRPTNLPTCFSGSTFILLNAIFCLIMASTILNKAPSIASAVHERCRRLLTYNEE